MAYGARLDSRAHRVFVLLSDGECDEGSTWEAILFAAHHRLDRLVAIVDYNKLQSLASVSATMELEPFAEKWRAFGWSVAELDGHDHQALHAALSGVPTEAGKPTVIIAHTTKGKGVPYMEDHPLWHGSVKLTPEQINTALAALDTDAAKVEGLLNGRG